MSNPLSSSNAAHFQSLIGILRWIVELGRIDMTVEVSMLASMMALPREGHLEQAFHMFAYLKNKHNAEMVLDPSIPNADDGEFPKHDWSHAPYSSKRESIPGNLPEPRGYGFNIVANVDSDHAGDSITRRSRTGFIAHCNNAPMHWHSKKQGGIKTSSFSAEFMAMKTCCEYLRGLQCKLRMMGINVNGPSCVYGDNKSALVNSGKPDSVLKKKSVSIA